MLKQRTDIDYMDRRARNFEVALGMALVLGALCVLGVLVLAGVDVVRWLWR
jgi:hypothetical protein